MGSTPSAPGYFNNTPSNDSQDQQLQDLGIGPSGGPMPTPSPSPDSSRQASSDSEDGPVDGGDAVASNDSSDDGASDSGV